MFTTETSEAVMFSYIVTVNVLCFRAISCVGIINKYSILEHNIWIVSTITPITICDVLYGIQPAYNSSETGMFRTVIMTYLNYIKIELLATLPLQNLDWNGTASCMLLCFHSTFKFFTLFSILQDSVFHYLLITYLYLNSFFSFEKSKIDLYICKW